MKDLTEREQAWRRNETAHDAPRTNTLAAPQLKSCATASIMAIHRSGEVLLAALEAEVI
jgi:hypothetical protein